MHERFDYTKMYQDYLDALEVVESELGDRKKEIDVLEDKYDEIIDVLKSKGFPHKIAEAWTDCVQAGGDYVKAFNDKVYSEHL